MITLTRESKLTIARPGSKSLRTTVPVSIVDYLDLKEGDNLKWEMESDHDGVRVAVVRRSRTLKKLGHKSQLREKAHY